MIRSSSAVLGVLVAGAVVAGCSEEERRSTGSAFAAVTSSVEFEVVIENLSDRAALATPLSPGLVAVHDDRASLFVQGAAAPPELERLAEDGDPNPLMSAALGFRSVDGLPVTPPGATQTIRVTATPSTPRLSLAAMIVESNDLFIAADPDGILLFDPATGAPISTRDVTSQLRIWDAGTEVNEPPGFGPYQPFRQAAPDSGPAEGSVRRFMHTTRGLPVSSSLAGIDVTEARGVYTLTFQNVSASSGAMTTGLSPLFWAVHDDTWSLFTAGRPAPANGLERLAEDGDAAPLGQSAGRASGVRTSGVQGITVERPADAPGGVRPGERFRIQVQPDAAHRRLSIASMVGASNDWFLALGSDGVELLDAQGAPRPAAEVQADMERLLAVWDAGTEADEAPGAGSNQPGRQRAANTGPLDGDRDVRRAGSRVNDLADAAVGGRLTYAVTSQRGSYQISVTNSSGGTSFALSITPIAWALHDASFAAFTPGQPASPALAGMAEDGDAAALAAAWRADPSAPVTGVADRPAGAQAAGLLAPGATYTFTVTPTQTRRFLSMASMILPSNDAFWATPPQGVALIDGNGALRSAAAVAADLRAMTAAWDAGSEQNQVGASGPDQAPRQTAPDTGADEGVGLVRVHDDRVWAYPAVERLVRVTIRPVPRAGLTTTAAPTTPATPPSQAAPAPSTGPAAAGSFVTSVRPIVQRCTTCHRTGGVAGGTRLVLTGDDTNDHAQVLALTNPTDPRASLLLQKATGAVTHLGGPQLQDPSPEVTTIVTWLQNGRPLR